MASSFKVTTKKIRMSYPHIWEKDQNEKYSMTVLVPKSDKDTVDKIMAAVKGVYDENKNGALKGLLFDEVAKPYHDGDGRKPKGGAYGDECKGCYVINAKSNNPVPVVERDPKVTCTDESHIYPGCYGRVNLGFYAYNSNGNRGIGAFLNGIQTYNYGDRIGNNFNAEEFADGYEDPDENIDDEI